jgi:hypothetical protein
MILMPTFRKPVILGLILCSLLQISPHPVAAYQYSETVWIPVVYPADAQISRNSNQNDLDGDGRFEILSIHAGQAALESNGKLVWQSPITWNVKQGLMSDLNNDGQPEITLLLTRPYQSWPVDRWLPYGGRISSFQDAFGQSCHIILIGWVNGRYKETWAGSSMSEPAIEIGVVHIQPGGRDYLVTLESEYDNPILKPGHIIKTWEWNGFGFSLLSSLPGEYGGFLIIQSRSDPEIDLVVPY